MIAALTRRRPRNFLARMPLLPRMAAAAAALVLLAPASARDVSWQPVSPADRAPGGGVGAPAAPAEVLFRHIDIDDSDYPSVRRVSEYVRYKIFDPEKAAGLTRVAEFSASQGGVSGTSDIKIAARVTNPDGSVRLFGREALRERSVFQSASDETWLGRLFGSGGLKVHETFLAVAGMQKGAILEIQSSYEVNALSWDEQLVLQQKGIPIRDLDLTYRMCTDPTWEFREFTLNARACHATLTADEKHKRLFLTAHDVPALHQEPYSGPLSNYALMVVAAYQAANTYIALHHWRGETYQADLKARPWSGYATEMYMIERDRTYITYRIKRLAATLTAGGKSDAQKAAAIHDYVQALYQRFLRAPARPVNSNLFGGVGSLDEVLDFNAFRNVRIQPVDFVWLAIALYRSAGLEAHTVMLPNRTRYEFDPRLVADMMLPSPAARVRVGGEWKFSDPVVRNRCAFGELPWPLEGSDGLGAGPGTQECGRVPLPDASASAVRNSATFVLDSDGQLSGSASRTYTGFSAAVVRNHLLTSDPAHFFRNSLESEFKPARVKIKRVVGASDPGAALRVDYTLAWPDYGVRTKSRLIFRPSVFHGNVPSPFPDSVRHYNFEFPYRWSEFDHCIIAIPAGYRVESRRMPPSMPGKILSYSCSIAQEQGSGKIHYDRAFASNLLQAPPTAIAPLKRWYDQVAAFDRFELVLASTHPEANTDTDAAP